MPSMDESIEAAVVALIVAAIPAASGKTFGRKKPGMREGDSYPIILVRCQYGDEEVGNNEDEHRRNCFYTLYIFIQTRSPLADTGDETINDWRQKISKALFGPTIAAVPEVDDIIPSFVPSAALPPWEEGIDTQALGFEVETYESLS